MSDDVDALRRDLAAEMSTSGLPELAGLWAASRAAVVTLRWVNYLRSDGCVCRSCIKDAIEELEEQ